MAVAEAKILGKEVAGGVEEMKEGGNTGVRKEFRCAMTGEMMTDPVLLTVDQKVYEKKNIVGYLAKHGKAPGGQVATVGELVALEFLKEQILEVGKLRAWFLED